MYSIQVRSWWDSARWHCLGDTRACLASSSSCFHAWAESEPPPLHCCIPALPSPGAPNELGHGLETGRGWKCGRVGWRVVGAGWWVLAWLCARPAWFRMLLVELLSQSQEWLVES